MSQLAGAIRTQTTIMAAREQTPLYSMVSTRELAHDSAIEENLHVWKGGAKKV
jgi:hypothetical protein